MSSPLTPERATKIIMDEIRAAMLDMNPNVNDDLLEEVWRALSNGDLKIVEG